MNTGKLVWTGRKLVYIHGEKDRPEANPAVIELSDVKSNQSIKITGTLDKIKVPVTFISELLTGIGPVTSALPMRRSTD